MDPLDSSTNPWVWFFGAYTIQSEAWDHCIEVHDGQGKRVLICSFCKKMMKGGGINRMKKHMYGSKGNVDTCKRVDPKVKALIKKSLDESL